MCIVFVYLFLYKYTNLSRKIQMFICAKETIGSLFTGKSLLIICNFKNARFSGTKRKVMVTELDPPDSPRTEQDPEC